MNNNKPIPGYAKYEISESGDIYRLKTNKIMTLDSNGLVQLTGDDGKRKKNLPADLLELADKDSKEEDTGEIKKGDNVTFTPFRSDKELSGVVTRVFPGANQPGIFYVAVLTEDGKKYDKMVSNVKLKEV